MHILILWHKTFWILVYYHKRTIKIWCLHCSEKIVSSYHDYYTYPADVNSVRSWISLTSWRKTAFQRCNNMISTKAISLCHGKEKHQNSFFWIFFGNFLDLLPPLTHAFHILSTKFIIAHIWFFWCSIEAEAC